MTTIALHRKAQPLISLITRQVEQRWHVTVIEVNLQGVNAVSACFQVSLVKRCY